jgi:hypothetical protein
MAFSATATTGIGVTRLRSGVATGVLVAVVVVVSAVFVALQSGHDEPAVATSAPPRPIPSGRDRRPGGDVITVRPGAATPDAPSSGSAHRDVLGVESWEDASISNPTERLAARAEGVTLSERLAAARAFFSLPKSDDARAMSAPPRLAFEALALATDRCTIPAPASPRMRVKYGMAATLCWAPVERRVATGSGTVVAAVRGCLGLVRVATANLDGSTSVESTRSYCHRLRPAANRTSDAVPSVSPDAEWAERLRQVAGPLHLRLILEGPETVVATAHFHASRCEYWLHWFVASPGAYGVNFKVAHDDFWGADETHHRTRHNLGAYWFPRSMPMMSCALPAPPPTAPDRHRDAATAAASPARWVQRPMGLPRWHGRHVVGSTLQLVELGRPVIGVDPRAVPPFGVAKLASKENTKHALSPWQSQWRAAAPGDAAAAAVSASQREGWVSAAARALALDFPHDRWLSAAHLRACARRLRSARPSQAPSGRAAWLFVTGDSQSRSVMWALKNYLQTAEARDDATPAATGATLVTDAADSFAARAADGGKIRAADESLLRGEWRVSYRWDSYLDALQAAGAANASALPDATDAIAPDVLVAGYGSHPASWGQWSFRTFAARTRRIAAALCAAAARGTPVVWYGAPAWPKPKLVDNFRATNQRLALFNGIALAALEAECAAARPAAVDVELIRPGGSDTSAQAGGGRRVLRVVDFFGMTSSVMKLSKDGSHYDGTVVAPTLAHAIFSSLC